MNEASDSSTTLAPSPRPGAGSARLVRALGLGDSVSLIVGIMVGSGIFLMAGSIALQLHSLVAVMSVWAFGGLLSLCGAASLSELGAALPEAGGLYVYITRAFGREAGFVYGWSALALIHAGSLATLAAAMGLYVGPILDLSGGQRKLLEVGSIAAFVVINCLGVSVGKWVQNSLTGAKLAGVAAMTLLLYWRGNFDVLQGQWTPHGGLRPLAFGVALLAVLWAYDGWHFVSFAAGEVKEPERTLPRSLLLGTGLVIVVYLLVNLAYYAVLSPTEIQGTNRVAALAVQHALGSGAALLISLLITISILGTMNGITLGASRVSYAMAEDGLFFRSFARINPRFRTPVVATIAQGGFAAVFALLGTFQQLFTYYVFTSWIFYAMAVGGVIVLRRREPRLARPYKCPWYPITPVFFLLASVGIVVGTFVASFRQAILGVGLILIGVPLYYLYRLWDGRQSVKRAEVGR